MLEALRRWLRRLMRPGPADTHFSEDDERLALAALLVHCMAIDGAVGDAERGKLRAVLAGEYGLTGDLLDALIDDAIRAEHEAIDLYRFTSVLSRRLDAEGRRRVVRRLWEVVYADGAAHEFEENLVWRVAELLGVESRERLAIRSEIAGAAPEAPGTA